MRRTGYPKAELTEVFYVDADANVHQLPVLYTISISIQQYIHKCIFKTLADAIVQVRTVLLPSGFGSSTRGERHTILTMLTIHLTPMCGASCGV